MMQTQARLTMTDDKVEIPHVIERMASIIAEQIKKTGQCPVTDLRAKGFSLNEIARYWPDACRLAEAKRPRTIK